MAQIILELEDYQEILDRISALEEKAYEQEIEKETKIDEEIDDIIN